MNFLLWGITLGTVGKLVLGYAVLRVHIYILREHRIDSVVLRAIKKEQYVTFLGLILIVIGFLFEILFYNSATELLSCTGESCTALLSKMVHW